MTAYRTAPEPMPIGRESKATLLGTAIVLVMGGLVIGSALILAVASIALGDTAFDLP